jgi:predicted alpha-1,6-mannanase (GH76 family)
MNIRLGLLSAGLLLVACSPGKPVAIPEAQKTQDSNPAALDPETPKNNAEESNPRNPSDSSNINGGGTNPVPQMPAVVYPEFPAVHTAVASLQSFYDPATGLWSSGWWGSANTLTSIIDYMEHSGSREYLTVIDTTFEKNKASNFLNDSYADTGWWGLAWLRAYDLTKQQKYLDMAKVTADTMMTAGWDDVCGGGIYWKTDKASKNAVENELYIKLAAGLHNRIQGDTKYLANAEKTWKWFLTSGLINSSNLVNDSLLKSTCKSVGEVTWSYNQGTILGALTELYKATQDMTYLTKAKELALASSKSLVLSGNSLKERNDPGCGTCMGDERLYKGIYVRNLRELNDVLKEPAFESLLATNAKSAWEQAKNNDLIGFRWEGPFDSLDAQRQTSAVDLFNSRLKNKFSTNLAINGSTVTSGSCAVTEAGAQAVDGSAKTKWCAAVANGGIGAMLDIDLGGEKNLKSIRILHAGAGGEALLWNTSAYEVLTATTSTGPFVEVVKVTGNRYSATYHELTGKARFIRLHITNGGADTMARIYEVNVE